MTAEATAKSTHESKKPVVLVVDDSLTSRMIAKNALEKEGMEVILATDGEEGLKLALERRPSVTILDVVLPGPNGIQLCTEWLARPELSNTPVLLMSGQRSDKNDRLAALNAGALGYLIKPFSAKEMLLQVQLLVQVQSLLTHRELKQRALEAEAASQSKSVFLAQMSHELRTPLTAVLGYTEVLAEQILPGPELYDSVAIIKTNTMYLLSLLSDMLDLSGIEFRQFNINLCEFSLLAVVKDVLQVVEPLALHKGLELNFEPADPFPTQIVTDLTRLKQILINLLHNAVNHTAKGSVTLKLYLERERGFNYLRLDVIDTGRGLTEKECNEIFLPFVKNSFGAEKGFGPHGSGLGLAISRELARRLGGDIEVKSQKGQGSAFSCRIKVEVRKIAETEAADMPHTQAKRESREWPSLTGSILVIEDGYYNQRLVKRILDRTGVKSVIVETGEEGLLEAKNMKFDLILVDIQLPTMNGFEVTTKLRDQGYKQPIIAFTAHVLPSLIENCYQAGCDDYLTKPFVTEKLLLVLQKYLRPQ